MTTPAGQEREPWSSHQQAGILLLMNDPPLQPSPGDYLLLPSVTHPGGREKAFEDASKAMRRFVIEANNNPTVAYPIDKTDPVGNAENRKLRARETGGVPVSCALLTRGRFRRRRWAQE